MYVTLDFRRIPLDPTRFQQKGVVWERFSILTYSDARRNGAPVGIVDSGCDRPRQSLKRPDQICPAEGFCFEAKLWIKKYGNCLKCTLL